MSKDVATPTPDTRHIVTVAGNDFPVDRMNIWKEIRVADIVTEIMEVLPNLISDLQAWEIERVKASEEIITPDDIAEGAPNRDEYLEFLKNAGDTEEDVLKAGPQGLPYYAKVNDVERAVFIGPKVWRAASPQIARLLALITVPNEDLRAAETNYDCERLVEKQAQFIEQHGDGDQLIPLTIVAFGIVANEVRKVVEAGKSPATTALLQDVLQNIGLTANQD